MFYAARDGKTRILDFLNGLGLEVNEVDLYGQTPVYYAARENKLEFVRRMIDYGCDLKHVDNLSSQTPLFYAAREGHTEMCKILMDVITIEYLSMAVNPSIKTLLEKLLFFMLRNVTKRM